MDITELTCWSSEAIGQGKARTREPSYGSIGVWLRQVKLRDTAGSLQIGSADRRNPFSTASTVPPSCPITARGSAKNRLDVTSSTIAHGEDQVLPDHPSRPTGQPVRLGQPAHILG